jgi:hypothetical protein
MLDILHLKTKCFEWPYEQNSNTSHTSFIGDIHGVKNLQDFDGCHVGCLLQ